jgi:protein-S-isoprenylcysteine O-methyltransferase Ste14
MLILRGLIGGLIQLSVLAALLLVPAGTWHWPRAVQLETRLEAPAAESQPLADRIVTPLFVGSLFAFMVFIPIDVFRLQLLPRPPLFVSIVGAVVSIAGYALIWTTLFQNAFAAPIVKDQSERGQVLIDTGLYSRVRHPFYLGFLLFFLGLALWLQSYAGALMLPIVVFPMVARISVEERTLRETLAGYPEYMERVRYRLLPFVW